MVMDSKGKTRGAASCGLWGGSQPLRRGDFGGEVPHGRGAQRTGSGCRGAVAGPHAASRGSQANAAANVQGAEHGDGDRGGKPLRRPGPDRGTRWNVGADDLVWLAVAGVGDDVVSHGRNCSRGQGTLLSSTTPRRSRFCCRYPPRQRAHVLERPTGTYLKALARSHARTANLMIDPRARAGVPAGCGCHCRQDRCRVGLGVVRATKARRRATGHVRRQPWHGPQGGCRAAREGVGRYGAGAINVVLPRGKGNCQTSPLVCQDSAVVLGGQQHRGARRPPGRGSLPTGSGGCAGRGRWWARPGRARAAW